MLLKELIQEDNSSKKYPDNVFLKPNQLSGSYTDDKLRSLGFNKSSNGSWYIRRTKYDELVKSGQLKEGLKTNIAAAGLAGAMALGGLGYDKLKNYFSPQQAQQQTQPVQPAKPVDPQPDAIFKNELEQKLINYATQAGIKGTELAQFLAQCAHETQNFTRMIERGSLRYFNNYEKKHNPRNAKLLGNKFPGDGAKFKGRGYVQLTGRFNYTDASKDLGIDLVNNPDQAADPDIAAKIAVWFWNDRVKRSVSDFNDTAQVTKKINSKLHGLDRRENLFGKYVSTMDD